MRYFLIRDQQSYGPYDVTELDAYLKSGNVAPADRLESEDHTVRTTVADLLTFRAVPTQTPPASPAAPSEPIGFQQPSSGGASASEYPPIGLGGSPTSGTPPGTAQYGAPQYGSPQYGPPQQGTPQYGAPQFGRAPYGGGPQPQISNHLVLSIAVTALCCLPFGIAGIVYASQVNTKLALGDIPGAMHSSKQARLFSLIGVAISGGFWILYLGAIGLGALAR